MRSEAFTLEALALHFAGAAHGLRGFAGPALRRLLEMAAQLHFPEDAFALHLFLERLQRLIDIVIPNQNLHLAAFSCRVGRPPIGRNKKRLGRVINPEVGSDTTSGVAGKWLSAGGGRTI